MNLTRITLEAAFSSLIVVIAIKIYKSKCHEKIFCSHFVMEVDSPESKLDEIIYFYFNFALLLILPVLHIKHQID